MGWSNTAPAVLEATTVIVTSGAAGEGVFVYSSNPPAAGTLIATVVPSAGTDPYGNHYAAGISEYNNSSDTFVSLQNGTVYAGKITSSTPDLTDASQFTYVPGGVDYTLIKSHLIPAPGSLNDAMQVQLFPGAAGVSPPQLIFTDGLGTATVQTGVFGAHLYVDNTGTFATWQPPALGTGWSTASIRSARPISYRKDALDNLVIAGSVEATTTTPSSTIFTTAAGYHPINNMNFLIHHQTSGGTLVNVCTGFLTTTGAVQVFDAGTITAGDIFSIAVTLPLGNIA